MPTLDSAILLSFAGMGYVKVPLSFARRKGILITITALTALRIYHFRKDGLDLLRCILHLPASQCLVLIRYYKTAYYVALAVLLAGIYY
jgi:hypothetical protein